MSESCLDICLASCNLVGLCLLSLMRDVGSDHYPLIISVNVAPKSYIIGWTPKWKVKDADWGLRASKIPDSTLESSNSATELNDDLEKIIEQASTTLLGKTSSVPFTGRKTLWWNGLCRNAVFERRKARKMLEKMPSMSNLKAYQEKTNTVANIIKKQKYKSWSSLRIRHIEVWLIPTSAAIFAAEWREFLLNFSPYFSLDASFRLFVFCPGLVGCMFHQFSWTF